MDGPAVPGWLAAAAAALVTAGIGQVILTVSFQSTKDGAPQVGGPDPGSTDRWSLLALFQRIDAARPGLPHPLPPVAVEEVTPGALHLRHHAAASDPVDGLPAPLLDTVRDAAIDLLIADGPGPDTLVAAARLGVLRVGHGPSRHGHHDVAGVWEVLQDRATTEVSLILESAAEPAGRLLARSIGTTQRFSFQRNRAHLLARLPTLIRRAAAGLREGGIPRALPVTLRPETARAPGTGAMIRYLPALLTRYTRDRIRAKDRRRDWQLAWRWRAGTPDAGLPLNLETFHPIDTPPDQFLADPFITREGGQYWVFFEVWEYAKGVGGIAALAMDSGGPVGSPRVVLQEPWHLSFPFLFQHEGAWFMVPEAADSGQVRLYRAVEFPDRWEPHATLLEHTAMVDPCLIHHEDRWYLFGTVIEPGLATDEELHLFSASALTGPFLPHPRSPLVTDVTCARMAGAIWRAGGALYRPAQICAPTYGHGITMRRIERLTPEEYEEAPATELGTVGSVGVVGLHTYNALESLEMIDLHRILRRSRRS